jgi:cytochrome c peroxidase
MRQRSRFTFARLLAVLTVAALLVGHIAAQAPDSSPQSETARAELGRLLFWDPILSGHKDVACATCHHPDFAYADGRDLSRGAKAVGLGPARVDRSGGQIPPVKRNSPTVLNVAFNGLDDDDDDDDRRRPIFDGTVASVNQARAPMFWDSRMRSLEAQALEPIKALEEMRGTAYPENAAVETVVTRLKAIPQYVTLFERAFGPTTRIDGARLAQAIAAFERTLIAMNSPFDRLRAGDVDALSPQQRRGLETFDEVGCDRCHEGVMFSDFDLAAEGVREHPSLRVPDVGDGRFRFRTPSLRNVAVTAPYMHNGTLATLEAVLRFYDNGRSENPNVSNVQDRDRRRGDGTPRLSRSFVRVDDMSEREMQDIIAFLRSLTDSTFDRTIPARVPSGLPVGGLIQSH